MASLSEKMQALSRVCGHEPTVVQRFGDVLAGLEGLELVRINPFALAEQHGLPLPVVLDLFIAGARVGLFEFSWGMVCPYCGGIGHSGTSVNDVRAEGFHCVICDLDVPGHLDGHVEVSFTLSADVKPRDLDAVQDFATYRHMFFSRSVTRSAPMAAYAQDIFRDYAGVPPGETAELHFTAEAGRDYRVVSINLMSVAHLPCREEPSSRSTVELDGHAQGFSPAVITVAPGPVTVRVTNHSPQPVGATLLLLDRPRVARILAENPPVLRPFLTAKRLLTTQSFQQHFRIQQLVAGLKLSVRSLTVLFTDLKGSTELYDRTGDLVAYQFVHEHFKVLTGAVQAHGGAVIKTMGDAIMATFSEPPEAVRAAVAMLAGVEELNRRWEVTRGDVRLKVGIHEGPALAINAEERLDYFGQTINLAARVQGLAHGGELCLTDRVERSPGVAEVLREAGFTGAPESAQLKGVAGATTVHRLRPA